jgi:hypothetical protein
MLKSKRETLEFIIESITLTYPGANDIDELSIEARTRTGLMQKVYVDVEDIDEFIEALQAIKEYHEEHKKDAE